MYWYLKEFPTSLQVAFVAIGATMVGSIIFSKKLGEYVQKGDEVHLMSFVFLFFFSFLFFQVYLFNMWLAFWPCFCYFCSLVISHLVEVLLYVYLKRLVYSNLFCCIKLVYVSLQLCLEEKLRLFWVYGLCTYCWLIACNLRGGMVFLILVLSLNSMVSIKMFCCKNGNDRVYLYIVLTCFHIFLQLWCCILVESQLHNSVGKLCEECVFSLFLIQYAFFPLIYECPVTL